MKNVVSVKKCVICDTLKYNGEALLKYRIEYPEFCSSCFNACLRQINMFYKQKALDYQKYCTSELYAMAIEQYKYDIENGFPVRMYEAMEIYEVTYLRSCIISVYFDQYQFTGGAHGNTVRTSQTWNLRDCDLLKLEQLVLCEPDYKTYILTAVEAQIKKEPEIYFENYEELIEEAFNKCSFYCKPQGLVLYYQQYDIAPYSSGIREFLIPYTYCVLDPIKLCCMP